MRKIYLLGFACAAGLTVAAPARAQWIVYDPTNFGQNVLTAARELQQVNNEIQSLQNEAQMLLNQAKNLTSLNFSVVSQLESTISRTEQLISQAQGLTFNLTQAEQQFTRLYPTQYGSVSNSQLTADAQTRLTTSLQALGTAVNVQSQVATNLPTDGQTLSDITSRSESAVGLLQAVQATNQLMALQAKQALQEQQLHLAADRATTLEQARAVVAAERAQAVRQSFQVTGSVYTPAPVQFFHDD